MAHSPPLGTPPADLEEEIRSLYQQHAPALLRYACGAAGVEEAARDAVQEAFLRYFLARAAGARVRHARAWLYRVIRNLLVDERRSIEWRNEIGLEDAPDSPDSAADPELLYWGSEMARVLERALSPRELDCMRLRVEGLSYEEISEVLGIRPGTVGALLARAHQKYRRIRDTAGWSAEDLSLQPAREKPYAP